MSDTVSERTTVENPNLWHPVAVIREWPDLDALGPAGARMKLDLLLLKPEGLTPEDLDGLRDEDIRVLRSMALSEDPAYGVTHQVGAIGALAEKGDGGALLLLSDRARDLAADDRIRIAAVHALGEIGGPAVAAVVRGLVRDKQPLIRAQAVLALAKVGTAADIETLEQVVGEGGEMIAPLAQRAAEVLRARVGLE